MPNFTGPPSGSPFLSVFEKDPDRPAAKLRTLILSDLKGVPQRIAQLSEWLSARNHSFTIDLILVIGISRPAPNCKTTHQALAEQANDSATIAQLENICPRVVYVPGLHEHPSAWDTKESSPPRLTPFSHNAIAGPLHVAPDLSIVHRRFADGISDKPIHHLPVSWRHTIYARLTRPGRFRVPSQPSSIVLCSSQLPDDHTSTSKAMGLLRTVRSLLSLNRSTASDLDFILAIAPPKMQRIPNSSAVFRIAERTLDPGCFSEGYFCLATFVRPDVWDPEKEPDIDEEQLACESAWEVENITKYNLDKKQTDDGDDREQSVGDVSVDEDANDEGDDDSNDEDYEYNDEDEVIDGNDDDDNDDDDAIAETSDEDSCHDKSESLNDNSTSDIEPDDTNHDNCTGTDSHDTTLLLGEQGQFAHSSLNQGGNSRTRSSESPGCEHRDTSAGSIMDVDNNSIDVPQTPLSESLQRTSLQDNSMRTTLHRNEPGISMMDYEIDAEDSSASARISRSENDYIAEQREST